MTTYRIGTHGPWTKGGVTYPGGISMCRKDAPAEWHETVLIEFEASSWERACDYLDRFTASTIPLASTSLT